MAKSIYSQLDNKEGVIYPEKTAFQIFCEEHPEVLELRQKEIISV